VYREYLPTEDVEPEGTLVPVEDSMVEYMKLPRVTMKADGAYLLSDQRRNRPFRCSSHTRKMCIKKLNRLKAQD
jgi:hypothetical protein